ncbi:MAG: hypothetical protein R2691_02325 [Solirubrobacterales bacterium]
MADATEATLRPNARGKKASPGRGAKSAARRAPSLPRDLEQRHLDLIGLGLLAAALYLGFVLYAGWDGGSAATASRLR